MSYHPNMTIPSEAFTGPVMADRDTEPGELIELPESVKRRLWACLSPLEWDDSLLWTVRSAGYKRGEAVVLASICVEAPPAE